MSYEQQPAINNGFQGNISSQKSEMVKLQVALVPPNCYPIYSYSSPNMMMNPYALMMNPYSGMMQQQMFSGMQQGMPLPLFNSYPQQGSQQNQQQPLGIESVANYGLFGQNSGLNIEFHPKVLTFNVFIDSSKTILQLADAIYAKSSRLYPNLKRPIEILKIKDFEKNDLDVEDLISDNYHGSLRMTVLCIVKHPLDFNKNKNSRLSYVPSEIEGNDSENITGEEDRLDNSDIYSTNNETVDETNHSRVTSMTQLQLSRKRNVSLVYQNRQKVPSLIVQKKRKSLLFNDNSYVDYSTTTGKAEESVLPPPVERSPQMRISSNIGETRKRIFSSNLGQSNDAVSRSEEVDPDKRKTIDMVFAESENGKIPKETPLKEPEFKQNGFTPAAINLYDATPNRLNSRIVSASNTVVKSQPIPNMMASVQRHTISKQNNMVESNFPMSPTVHGKLDSKGTGEPILQSPGSGILPPRADRIPMKQGLDVEMENLSSSSLSEEEEEVAENTVEKMSAVDSLGELTPLNVKSSGLAQVSEESPIRIGESNRSLVEMAKLPNENVHSDQEKKVSDDMEVENESVVLNPIENAAALAPAENGRTKRKAALAAAGRMDNKVVRVTDKDGKEVMVPYNKVNSFMKNTNSNNLFDSLSSTADGLKGINSPLNSKILPAETQKNKTNESRPKSASPSPSKKQPLSAEKRDIITTRDNDKMVIEADKVDGNADKLDVEADKLYVEADKMDVDTSEDSGSDANSETESGSSTDDDSGTDVSSDDDEEEEEEEEQAKLGSQKPRKVVVDTSITSQRVPSAKQQPKKEIKTIEPAKPSSSDAAKETTEKLSTLQRMRMHNKTKSLGSLSDLAARGIPPVHDKAAEKRLLLEKKRKEEEEDKQEQIGAKNSDSEESESESSDSDSDEDSSDDSDSESGDENNSSKPTFIKKAKKKSSSAFASLVKDSKKI